MNNNKNKIAILQATDLLPRNIQSRIMNNYKRPHKVRNRIAAGSSFSLGIRPNGSVVGWGEGNEGQLQIQNGTFVSIAVGDSHSLGLRPNGSVVGWRYGRDGQTEAQTGPFVDSAAG